MGENIYFFQDTISRISFKVRNESTISLIEMGVEHYSYH